MRPSLTPQQESEIIPLIDYALTLPYGKAIVYPCQPSRAEYLARIITGERYRCALESIEIYQPPDPLYGIGHYGCIVAEPHPKGLVLAQLQAPRDSLPWRLIQCAAWHEPVKLDWTYGTSAARLIRMRRRYHDVLKRVWIDPGPPVVARYGEPTPEELIVVDIDVNPDKPLPTPTREHIAKSQK